MSSPKNHAETLLLTGEYDEDRLIAALRAAQGRMGGNASLALVYLSPAWGVHRQDIVELVQIHGHVTLVVGCSAGGLIGEGQEREDEPGVSVLLLSLPHTKLHCIDLAPDDFYRFERPEEWHRFTGLKPAKAAGWVVLGHPATMPMDEWLKDWNHAYPNVPTFGGLASGGAEAEDIFLFDSRRKRDFPAAILIGFEGGVRMEGIVSQGCRPIGEPALITEAADNLIMRISAKPAYEFLQETFRSLPNEERAAAQGNILAGFALNELVEEHQQGNFLVRHILGGDPEAGVLQVSAVPRVGQTLQFQLRDRVSADAEMKDMLYRARQRMGQRPFASLLFTCLGRGKQLFGLSHHDVSTIRDIFGGSVPVHGFFSNGELGSVGERTFLHSYTASSVFLTDAPD